MFHPYVASRVEKRSEGIRLRINSGEVARLVQVAKVASEAEIILDVGPTVLTGTNMFDVEYRERSLALEEPAVFAAVLRPRPHFGSQGLIHQP